MTNIRLAFERYLDVVAIQRRESLLKWSLSASNICLICDPTNSSNSSTPNNVFDNVTADKSLIANINCFLHPQLRTVKSIRRQIRLWKRDFTSSTKFFENNFDILVNADSDHLEIIEQGNKMFKDLQKDIVLFNGNRDVFTPDFIRKVSSVFQWLFQHKLYILAYNILHEKGIFDNLDLFFNSSQLSKIITTIDKCGTPDDLFHFAQVFSWHKTPKLFGRSGRNSPDRLNRLCVTPTIQMLQTLDSKREVIFEDIKTIIGDLMQHETQHKHGLYSIIFKILNDIMSKHSEDKELKISIYEYLMSLDEAKKSFPPALINQLFEIFKESHSDFDDKFNFLMSFSNFHSNDKEFILRLLLSIPNNEQTIRFKLWYRSCFQRNLLKGQQIDFDEDNIDIQFLNRNKLALLPKWFNNDIKFDNNELSNVISILMYSSAKYARDFKRSLSLYNLKLRNKIKITDTDNLSYLLSLIETKQYIEAEKFYKYELNSKISSSELTDKLMIVMAETRDWKSLEHSYNYRFVNNQPTTANQYKSLFWALSMRAGSNDFVMMLWKQYIDRGFQPNDTILCSIIKTFIRGKYYKEALEWFAAYKKYNINFSKMAYGLMINLLASLRDKSAVFEILNSLSNSDIKLRKKDIDQTLLQFALIGDYKSIEKIFTYYYPKFQLELTHNDTRYILKAHYFANRFGPVIDHFWRLNNDEIHYEDSLLALESALKFKSFTEFQSIWERIYPIHKERNELDIKCFNLYMAYWVRRFGTFGVQEKLDEIKIFLNIDELPISMFNQMMLSAIRTNKPYLAFRLVKIAIENDAKPSAKTYSMILQANTSITWITVANIDQTIKLFKEFHSLKNNDSFGKLDDDISAIAMKMVIKGVLKYRDVITARELYDLHIETSRTNRIENIHALSAELLILAAEERWTDFEPCYAAYTKVLTETIKEAKMLKLSKEEETSVTELDEQDFNRVDKYQFKYLNNYYDESLIKSNTWNVRIPYWLKRSHTDIWLSRLESLRVSGRLKNINEEFQKLIDNHIVFSNKNLNETALLLSKYPEFIDQTLKFIHTFILPWHIKTKSYEMMKLRYGLGSLELEEFPKPEYNFIPSVYFQVMKNINNTINSYLNDQERNDFLSNIINSSEVNILRNLDIMTSGYAFNSHHRYHKMRRAFYRTKRSNMRQRVNKAIRLASIWSNIDNTEELRNKELSIRQELVANYLKYKKEKKRLSNMHLSSSPKLRELSSNKIELRVKLKDFMTEKKNIYQTALEKADKEKLNSYMVGDIDLYKDI